MKNNTIAILTLILIFSSLTLLISSSKNLPFVTGFASSGASSAAFNLTEEVSVLVTGNIGFGSGRVFANASSAVLDSNLGTDMPLDYAAKWSFDTSSGSNSSFAVEERGLHNGNVSNATIVSGKYGDAYSFNGINGVIVLQGNQSTFKVANKTIAFWANTVFSTNDYCTIFGTYTTIFGYVIYFSTLKNIYVSYYNSTNGMVMADITPGNSVTYGSWNHYAVVFNVTGDIVNISAYKNGTLIGSFQSTGGIGSYPSTFSIGAQGDTTDVCNGSLDEIVFYNRTLSAEEINGTFTHDLSWPGAVNGTWKFERSFFTIENDGTVNVSLNVSADKNAQQFIGGTSPSFKIKGIVNEINACPNLNTTYAEVLNSTQTPGLLCPLLKYQNDADSIKVSGRLVVPDDVASGAKNSTITFTASKV